MTPDTWKHLSDALRDAYRFRAVSKQTGAVIAVGDDQSRVQHAAEILVGVGGFMMEIRK